MTLAEYARSQGWRVGDVLAIIDDPSNYIITGITEKNVQVRRGDPGEEVWMNLYTPEHWTRIGRVLRPNHTAAQSAKEGEGNDCFRSRKAQGN